MHEHVALLRRRQLIEVCPLVLEEALPLLVRFSFEDLVLLPLGLTKLPLRIDSP